MQKLSDFFKLKPGVTALIGGGGKTSTMYYLAGELREKGSVIVCTSTHILRPPHVPYLPRLAEHLKPGEVVSTGTIDGMKLSAPEQPFSELIRSADYVLVEADGSRQLPLKAHAPHEPVIPPEAKTVLVVIGVDGLGKPIREAAHRPERYAEICRASVDDPVTAEMIRTVVSTYPRCDGVIVNKADDVELQRKAESIAKLFFVPAAVTAYETGEPIKTLWRHEC
ncbi:MAG: putative selenium-dependent hydroxylase accessory protein YqeC [Clostridia bacterium]|nr:putative selenium-dependent hydroxylase accessory protein YqeC [Clostridia bacterium]